MRTARSICTRYRMRPMTMAGRSNNTRVPRGNILQYPLKRAYRLWGRQYGCESSICL